MIKLRTFLIINVISLFIGCVSYSIHEPIVGNVVRCVMMVALFDYYQKQDLQRERPRWYTSACAILTWSVIDALVVRMNIPIRGDEEILSPLFVPVCFVYELLYDMLFYIIHRTFHSVPLLYKYIHKQHHQYHHPTPISAFYMHPLDALISFAVPSYLSIMMIHSILLYTFSNFEYEMLMTYKLFIEVGGHSGIQTRSYNCIPCAFIPELLNIVLHIRDHDYHHSTNPNKNFGKRFSFCDKLIGTYHVQTCNGQTIRM